MHHPQVGNDSASPVLTGELLERETALDTLEATLVAAGAGEGRLLLVGGEAGVGKTALVRHFSERGAHLRVLWGTCDALFTPRPLGPFVEIAEDADVHPRGERPPGARDDGGPDGGVGGELAEGRVQAGDERRLEEIERGPVEHAPDRVRVPLDPKPARLHQYRGIVGSTARAQASSPPDRST